ncbi:MAG: sodium:solute symporter family protein [Planctomycetes bacterium]|nr:sodium:solute symporter family protein [Planctomycetota bacterium]
MSNWSPVDWVIIVIYVIFSGIIGVICRRYIHNMADFIVAGRRLKTGLAIATFSGTEMGLVTIMYMAEQGYTNGLSAFTIGVIAGTVMAIIGATGFIVYRLRQTGVMTIAELYEVRYSKNVRILGGVVIAGAGILNTGVFLRVGAQFLQIVTGMPKVAVILGHQVPVLNIVMTVLLVVVLLYTMLGGMISVVFTDYFQFIMIVLGMGIALIFTLWTVPFTQIYSHSVSVLGEKSLSPLTAPEYGKMFILWQFMLIGSASILWQTGTMRISAAKDAKTAQRVFLLTGLTNAARAIIPMLMGVAAICYFSTIATSTEITDSLEAMPIMISRIIPAGLLGVLVAGMLAAFMSTHDSYLLAWSSVITQDVVAPLTGGLSTKGRVLLTRVLILAIGIFLLVWGLWYPIKGTVWVYLAMTGTIYLSGAFALVVGALYWKRANTPGAIAALICGAIPSVHDLFLKQYTEKLIGREIPGGLSGMASYILAMCALIVVSLLTQKSHPPTPVDLTKHVEPDNE